MDRRGLGEGVGVGASPIVRSGAQGPHRKPLGGAGPLGDLRRRSQRLLCDHLVMTRREQKHEAQT